MKLTNTNVETSCLNYGQQCFEGLKAFRTENNRIGLFRPKVNSARLNVSASVIGAPDVPESLFVDACRMAVEKNAEFVPPYGKDASLYIRPLMLGSAPAVGLVPSQQYMFIVAVTPVGCYYADGIKPVDAVVLDHFDRAAEHGTGHAKVGGNYAPVFKHALEAKNKGYAITLHLDSKTHTMIDEFSTSNFIALKESPHGKTSLLTPESPSILKSITTKCMVQLADSYDWDVEIRPILWTEVSSFTEVAAAGTAAILTPINSITRGDEKITFGDGHIGKGFMKLYKDYRDIQNGDAHDKFGWMEWL